mgnify:CR=1 FL=1
MQAYSDPKREEDAYALPDIEVWYHDCTGSSETCELSCSCGCDVGEFECSPGWYWWSCFPGCLPDSDPCGPFETEAEALADARYVEYGY